MDNSVAVRTLLDYLVQLVVNNSTFFLPFNYDVFETEGYEV